MSTQITPAVPANGHAPNGMFCPTKKKFFTSRDEAETFEAKNRAQYNLNHQYAYACDKCNGFHLSSLPPDANAINANRAPHSLERAALTDPIGVRNMRIKELFHTGISYREIAEKLGYSLGTVGTAINDMQKNGELPYKFAAHQREKMGRTTAVCQPKIPVTIDAIAEQRAALEKQLQELTVREHQMREIKLASCWDGKGILITQNQERMGIRREDAETLIDKLTEFLTSGS